MAGKMEENKILALQFELLYVEFERPETWKTQKKGYRPKGSNVYSNSSNARNFCLSVRTPKRGVRMPRKNFRISRPVTNLSRYFGHNFYLDV